ncbi:thiamine/thiamine pyrophosphate ABC transporter permease ThiP [Vannielia sp.]|uniref:thiamine/thiamine pyrophosphate ABC transporter permease ThiP n=1 Tax=Vannielia sp. TaxID=2813045 RepID=UPI00260434F4|nr:thiamine/thiamine pyrophosphate ABC transporter permease ThiP [Vannielia sp.]MDF1874036.1 thiamine/thiamine pyrophosphate ABC transporter permease ThiP [Vannielia sp.]
MAARAEPVTRSLAGLAALVVLGLTLGTLGAVVWRAGGLGLAEGRVGEAIAFTLWQAAASAVLSVALAVPVARALARRRFVGRGAVITLMGAPFILPSIVAVLGLVAVFGRSGAVNWLLGGLGLPEVSLYGPQGVILAHVFFNLPLATRLLLQGWLAIPAERFRLAASFGMGPGAILRWLEWPMLRAVVPGALMLIFALCLTSFAVALTLGGGPKATTVELAIYTAFKFDFDLGAASVLALVQFALASCAAALAWGVARPSGFGAGLGGVVRRWDGGGWLRVQDALAVGLAALFLAGPLLAVCLRGAAGLFDLPLSVWAALGRSLAVALGSTALCLALALPLALAARRGLWVQVLAVLPIAASPLVMGTGLFLLSYRWVRPDEIALWVTAAVNAVLALPFALAVMLPAAREMRQGSGRLAESLGMRGVARLRLVVLPAMRRAMGFSAGLAAALSMGDLGVITLFADAQSRTLPYELYSLMGSYRMEQAAGAALLLLVSSLALFWLFDRGGRADAGA